jgi:hypothetical protein
MVSNERKVMPLEDARPIQFVLRDVEAADFEVKGPKEKPPPREKPPPEQVAPADVDLMSFGNDDDEEYNRLYEIEDPQKKSKRSKKKSQRPPSPAPSMTPSERSVTAYDGTTSETGSEAPLKDVTRPLVDISAQSTFSDWKPVRYYHNDLMPLPTDTLVVIPKANNKKKSNRRDTQSARSRRPTIETDLSKYGNLIDDLTDVFGQSRALSVEMTNLLI